MVLNDEKEIVQKIRESIKQADKVLVGIGNEFDVKWPEEDMNPGQYLGGVKCHNYITDNQTLLEHDKAYKNIKELLKDKDYAIISLTMDDAIYRVFDREDKLVCPCGGVSFLQCEKGCQKEVVPYQKEKEKLNIKNIQQPICPHCQAPMVFNNIAAETYVEEGYLPKFEEYKKWLQTTINRKLCILEFGVGLKHPGVIRFAFDKLAYYNMKSEFYRIHESLYQHTAENSDRGISVPLNSLDLMTKSIWEIQ